MKPDGPEPPEATTYAGTPAGDLLGRQVRFRPHFLVPGLSSLDTQQCPWTFAATVVRVLPEGVRVRYEWSELDGLLGQQLADVDELHRPACGCRACLGPLTVRSGQRWVGGDWRNDREWNPASTGREGDGAAAAEGIAGLWGGVEGQEVSGADAIIEALVAKVAKRLKQKATQRQETPPGSQAQSSAVGYCDALVEVMCLLVNGEFSDIEGLDEWKKYHSKS